MQFLTIIPQEVWEKKRINLKIITYKKIIQQSGWVLDIKKSIVFIYPSNIYLGGIEK